MTCRAVALLGAITSAWLASAVALSSQAPPTYEVVSIRQTDPAAGVKGTTFNQRPDGGITAINMLVTNLIARAYSGFPLADAPVTAREPRVTCRPACRSTRG